MNQQPLYESAYKIPRLVFHMDTNAEKENKMDALSNNEQRLFKILSQSNSETLISISIRERISSGSVRGFREMIKELHEQSLVAKNELIRAIGSEAVEIIEKVCC